jgi:hypothetical protein
MNIIETLKELQSIKSLEELKSKYSFKDLNNIRNLISQLTQETDTEFKKELAKNTPSKDILFKIWNSKTNLDNLNEIVFKSMSAIEREELIQKTSLLTEKLSNIVSSMD